MAAKRRKAKTPGKAPLPKTGMVASPADARRAATESLLDVVRKIPPGQAVFRPNLGPHSSFGRTAAPPPVVLEDEYGVPIPNCDQIRTDVHGRELQPESNPDMPYVPMAARPYAERARHKAWLAKERGEPFCQQQVDEVRFRVKMNLARSAVIMEWKPAEQPLRHLWWPVAGDIGDYRLRDGNAPADSDRPRHLRGLDLSIDITDIPDGIRHLLQPGGTLDQMVQSQLDRQPADRQFPTGVVLQETLARMAADVAWKDGDREPATGETAGWRPPDDLEGGLQ